MDTSGGMTPLLIDAKREYVGQLTDVLAPYVINHIARMYVTAQQQGKAPTLAFQKYLKEIPTWNSATIHERTMEIIGKYGFLGDLIAACFVAYVKILSSVKLHTQKPNIRLKLPTNDSFVHKVFVNVAREFYTNPTLIGADRSGKVALVKAAVESSVRDMLPIEDILKAYLGNTVDSVDNTVNPGEFHDEFEDEEKVDDQSFPSPNTPALDVPPTGFAPSPFPSLNPAPLDINADLGNPSGIAHAAAQTPGFAPGFASQPPALPGNAAPPLNAPPMPGHSQEPRATGEFDQIPDAKQVTLSGLMPGVHTESQLPFPPQRSQHAQVGTRQDLFPDAGDADF